ncbi:MAG: hypothetical protein P8X96_11645 [Desulfobacteraceae bacterium]
MLKTGEEGALRFLPLTPPRIGSPWREKLLLLFQRYFLLGPKKHGIKKPELFWKMEALVL